MYNPTAALARVNSAPRPAPRPSPWPTRLILLLVVCGLLLGALQVGKAIQRRDDHLNALDMAHVTSVTQSADQEAFRHCVQFGGSVRVIPMPTTHENVCEGLVIYVKDEAADAGGFIQ